MTKFNMVLTFSCEAKDTDDAIMLFWNWIDNWMPGFPKEDGELKIESVNGED